MVFFATSRHVPVKCACKNVFILSSMLRLAMGVAFAALAVGLLLNNVLRVDDSTKVHPHDSDHKSHPARPFCCTRASSVSGRPRFMEYVMFFMFIPIPKATVVTMIDVFKSSWNSSKVRRLYDGEVMEFHKRM